MIGQSNTLLIRVDGVRLVNSLIHSHVEEVYTEYIVWNTVIVFNNEFDQWLSGNENEINYSPVSTMSVLWERLGNKTESTDKSYQTQDQKIKMRLENQIKIK